MLTERTMDTAIEAVEFVRTAYVRNMGNDPDGMINDLKELDDVLATLKQVRALVNGDNDVLVVNKVTLGCLLEKMCDEINAQIEEAADYKVMYHEEVTELNQAIAELGIDTNMCEFWLLEDGDDDENEGDMPMTGLGHDDD